jgi:hypothetical protein
MLKTKAVVNAVVDTFQGAAPMISTPPGGTGVGGGYEDAPVLLGDRDAHDASVISRTDLAGLVALGLPLTFEVVSLCRMSSSLCVLPDTETVERFITTYRQRGKARWELKAVISTIRNPAVELREIFGLSIRLKTHRQSNLPAYILHPGKLRSRKSYTVRDACSGTNVQVTRHARSDRHSIWRLACATQVLGRCQRPGNGGARAITCTSDRGDPDLL